MCGAEPLVSLNSAESVDAFYKLLGEREHLSVSRPINVSPKWPAARNDHYCDQKVCRHAVLDLSPLYMPSDSGSDVQTPDVDISNTKSNTHSPICSWPANEHAGDSPRFNHEQHTPPSSHDGQVLQSSQTLPINSDIRTRARALRQELDNIHLSCAESYFELAERFIDLSDQYCILSSGCDRLAEKHDSLRHTVYKLVAQLDVHTEDLTALNEWKIRTQKSFAEVKVQDQDPELLHYGTPHSASTVEISTEQLEPDHVEATNPTSKTMVDRRDPGVANLETPLITPAVPLGKHVVRPKLVLRLPPRPDIEEERVKPTSGLVSDQYASSRRIRKTADKRKAAASYVKPIDKRAKKSQK
ncbi:unnamed protein product [Alternaria sp. RS040]